MSIHQSATCDGPQCSTSVRTPRADHYPDSWIVTAVREVVERGEAS